MIAKNRRIMVLLLFFASGLSGLIYEIVWMRHLAVVFGCTTYATATVLASFMGGLAIGSYLFGKIADRSRRQMVLYGTLEFLIGCFAVVFPFLLKSLVPVYVWFARLTSASYHSISLFQAILIMLILIIPTALMGGTLPLVTKYLSRTLSSLGSNLSFLYGINTLGAVVGCSMAGFVLIGSLGVRITTGIAVLINFLVAGIAIFLFRNEEQGDYQERTLSQKEDAAPITHPSWYPQLLLALFVLAGFTGLAYEVLWTRVLVFFVGGTTYAFTVMLSVYLAGLALGSMFISTRVDRSKRMLEVFGFLHLAVGIGILSILTAFPAITGAISSFLFRDGTIRFSPLISFIVLESGMALFLIFPITLLMGLAFPIMGKLYSEISGKIGSGVGTIYFADTIGAIAGSLAAGFLLIPRLGTLFSFEVMATLNLLIGVFAFSVVKDKDPGPRFAFPQFFVLIAFVTVLLLGYGANIPKDTFAAVFTAKNAKLAYLNEDIGGTVTIDQYPTYKMISINGINVAGTDLKFMTTQKLQAHLALLLHPRPQRVLQIGFGAGGTAWAITRHQVAQIDCVELTAAVIKACSMMEEVNHGVLQDPRVHVIIDDARSYLMKCQTRYDVILSDSIHPTLSGNGELYSVDYFRYCRKKLAPDGIFSAWLPFYGLSSEDYRVAVRSLREVFPHVYIFHTPVGRNEWTIVIGTLRPLRIDVEKLRAKMASAPVRADLGIIYLDRPESLLACFLIGDEKLRSFLGGSRTLNTNDFPYLEYVAPRSGILQDRAGLVAPLYRELVGSREPIAAYLLMPEGGPISRADIDTAYRVSDHLLQGRLFELGGREHSPEATAEFEKALALDPDNMIAKNLLGKQGRTK